MREDLVGVVIAVYGECEHLKACLEPLVADPHLNLRVYVVDHGRVPARETVVDGVGRKIVVIRELRPVWWTGATNTGVKAALADGCEWIMPLNPDTRLVGPAISNLLRAAETVAASAVVPVVVNRDAEWEVWEAGHLWREVSFGCLKIKVPGYLFAPGTHRASLPTEPFATIGITGRGSLISRKVFEMVGLYDERRLPHYGADTEFSLRVWRAGIKVFVAPDAVVALHLLSTGMKVPSDFVTATMQFFRYLFLRKNGEALRTHFLIYRSCMSGLERLLTSLASLGASTVGYWRQFQRQRAEKLGRI